MANVYKSLCEALNHAIGSINPSGVTAPLEEVRAWMLASEYGCFDDNGEWCDYTTLEREDIDAYLNDARL